jgi:Tfp pilus assembly protein PilN
MKLTGLAASDVQVAQYINHLSNSRLLKDVNLVISDEYTEAKEKVRKFQIEMTLDPDAEVHPADNSAAASTGQHGQEAR